MELKVKFSKEIFEKVFVHHKAKYEIELKKTRKPIIKTKKFIDEICNAFPEIKFDMTRCCFYNENEEIELWNKREGGEERAAMKPNGCDCCNIV